LEIEIESWEKIEEAIKLLELNSEDKKIYSTYQVYDVYNIKMKDYKRIIFEEMVLS